MAILTVRAFGPLMTQRVTIAPRTGYDSYGNAAYGTDVTYQCAVVGEMKLIRTARGQEAPSKQAIYLMSAAAIRPEDRVTLSTGDVNSTEEYAIHPPILAVGRYPFTTGQWFTQLFL